MKRHIGFCSVLALCISNAYALDIEKDFAGKMVDAIAYVDAHQAEVWPGFHISSTPFLGYFNVGNRDSGDIHAYAFNFKPKNAAWQRLTINQTPVYYLDKDLYNINNIAWGLEDIDDQETYVSGQHYERDGLYQAAHAVYFRFSFYQHEDEKSPFPKKDQWSYPMYGWIDNQAILAKLNFIEMEALKAFLVAKDEAAQETAVKDAVALNQYRNTLLDAESRKFEPTLSMDSGLAGYVSWKSLNLSKEQYTQAVPLLCRILDSATIDYDAIRDCLGYVHFEFSTLVYGLILDNAAGNEWKSGVEQTGYSPEFIVKKWVGLTDAEATRRATSIINSNRYNADKIDLALKKSYIPHLEEFANQENNYKQTSGIELEIYNRAVGNDDSKKHKLAKKDDHAKLIAEDIYWMNNKVALHKNYNMLADHADDGRLFFMEFKDLPYAFDTMPWSNWGSEWYKFKLSPDTVLVVDGKTDTLGNFMNSKQHVTFSQLLVKNANGKLKLHKVNGELDASGDNVKVKFKF